MTYRATTPAALLVFTFAACGGDDTGGDAPELGTDPFHNHSEGDATVIGGQDLIGPVDGERSSDAPDADATTGDPILVAQSPDAAPDGCLAITDELCVDPQEEGGTFCNDDGALDGPVDVIVVNGEVVDVICYPPADDPDRPVETVDVTTQGAVEIVQNANATTVVFDPATDGEPIETDITIDGNKVALYGNGPENTIIDGDVILDGNNPRIRGVTVLGNVIIMKNSGAVVLSVIHGNVELQDTASNNNVFVENDIYGDIIVPSNTNIFAGNSGPGEWNVTGSGNICDRNHAFTDDNEDFVVDDIERGDALDCAEE
ncbi:MAG: hypothetical protein OXT09_30430 [Myxococcales bacterium]|nr:hypothetical protein [Myxococcales bacterium]